MDVSNYSREKLIAYAQEMASWAQQLEGMTKELYYEFVQGTSYGKWYQERLAEMDVFVQDEEEERNTEAAWNYAVKCADTYQKAHPEDTETVKEFLSAAAERLV